MVVEGHTVLEMEAGFLEDIGWVAGVTEVDPCLVEAGRNSLACR